METFVLVKSALLKSYKTFQNVSLIIFDVNVEDWITYAIGYSLSGSLHHLLCVRNKIRKCLILCDLRIFKLYLIFKYFMNSLLWALTNSGLGYFYSALFIFFFVLDAQLEMFLYKLLMCIAKCLYFK